MACLSIAGCTGEVRPGWRASLSARWRVAGDVFPIHGTCLGFQLLHILEANVSFTQLLVSLERHGRQVWNNKNKRECWCMPSNCVQLLHILDALAYVTQLLVSHGEALEPGKGQFKHNMK